MEINQPIAVIAEFKPGEIPKPFRIKVSDKEGGHVFNLKIKLAERVGKEIIKYICSIAMNGIERECEIHYKLNEMRWFLYKMK